jgi:Transglycosylase
MDGHAANLAVLLGRLGSWLLAALRLVVKVIAGGLAVVAVALLLGFIAYDVLYFQPHRPQIAQRIAAATEEERNPPDTIVRVVRVAFGPFPRRPLANEVAVILLVELKQSNGSSLQWQVRQLLWWACVALHLSEREQIALVASRPGRRGFSTASQLLFGRPLASLSLAEAATVVAIYPSPNSYPRNPEALAARRDWLLSRLQTEH